MSRVIRCQNLKLALVAEGGSRVFPLSETRQVIGRMDHLPISVNDSKVSREHALVDFRNGFFYLIDLGSTNGTFVNGKRVLHAQRLNLGDQLRIGSSQFRVELLKKVQAKSDSHCVSTAPVAFAESSMSRAPLRPVEIKSVLSGSIPRWVYLMERNQKISQKWGRRQGVLVFIFVSTALILSAIFA